MIKKLGPDFEQNEKTPDYFRCQAIDDLIDSKRKPFANLEKAKNELLEPINAFFGEDPCLIFTSTSSYVRLMCKYSNCPFQIWYNYNKNEQAPEKIEFFRKINNNHSFDCHKNGTLKDKKLSIL